MNKFWKNKPVFSVIFAGSIAIIIGILAYFNVFQSWQLQLADNLYGTWEPSKDILIVAMDDSTQSQLGMASGWSREIYAKVLNNLNQYNPKIVAFDINFQSKKDDQGDQDFAAALSNTKNVVIGYDDTYDPKVLNNYYQDDPNNPGHLPLSLFTHAQSVEVSILKVIMDSDNVIRKILPIIYNTQDNNYHENFVITIARNILHAQSIPQQPSATLNSYTLKLMNGNDLTIPLEGAKMLINFFSKPSSKYYQTISLKDVYQDNYSVYGKTPADLFKDKIVLIGPWSNSFNDRYLTPVDKNYPMPGVEIHANALQTILDQKFLQNFTPLETIILILLLAFASVSAFMYTKIRWSVLYLFAVPAVYTFAAEPLFRNGIIVDLVHPYLTVFAAFIVVYMYRYLTEFREKMALQGAFGKYVNPTVVRQIAEHPEELKLGGRKQEITVMFTDIVHFTTTSEKLKPESLVALLNEYFQAMSDVVMAEGGTLDKFEGDAIMAFFGAPVAQKDHALRAARAALNMRVKLSELLNKWKNARPGPDGRPSNLLPGGETKPVIDFRCGLSTGEAIVGNMGSSERFDYTAMGDIVNLGSRLEGANKSYKTSIMISEKTHEAVKDQFETRELDTILVVGKTEPSKVFELIAPKGELSDHDLLLLKQYGEAIALYHERKYAYALEKFEEILKTFPEDGPSKLYRQRCEVYRDYPPKPDWNGVSEMGSK